MHNRTFTYIPKNVDAIPKYRKVIRETPAKTIEIFYFNEVKGLETNQDSANLSRVDLGMTSRRLDSDFVRFRP